MRQLAEILMSSIKIRLKRIKGITLVRTLIAHPMETGRRLDKETGQTIPAQYIEKLIVHHNEATITTCLLGPGISKDPYFAFRFKGGAPGDTVSISWNDNVGNSDTAQARIK